MTRRYYVTTPIYYVNGAPHIGHAYTSIAADVMARWKRLDGFEVFFLTGTDEHGQKVEKAAADAGVDPQTFVDRISADFRDMTDKMGVSYDQWIRTTEERHKVSSAELWRRIAANGHIYLGHYEGWYAVRDEAFYDDEELTTRPDGTKTAPSGAPVEWVREPSYFLDLSKWQDKLLDLYESQPDFILPSSRPFQGGSTGACAGHRTRLGKPSYEWRQHLVRLLQPSRGARRDALPAAAFLPGEPAGRYPPRGRSRLRDGRLQLDRRG